MEYGSLTNLMMGNTKSIDSNGEDIKVGMGATVVYWTDRHAFTIVEISKSGKTIKIQRDEAVRLDKHGMSESQEYEFKRNPEGEILTCRKSKNGVWKTLRSRLSVVIGKRREYYDYSF